MSVVLQVWKMMMYETRCWYVDGRGIVSMDDDILLLL